MSGEDNTEVDFSVITRAIKCGGSTVDQILNGIHYGTSEVRCLLLDECDIIMECKICRSLFRSLPNFIAHKRVYCLDAFEDPSEVRIPLHQGSQEDNAVVVEPVSPEKTASDDGTSHSRCNATTSEERVHDGSEVVGPTNTLDMTIQQLQEGTFEGTSEAYKFYTNVVDKVERNEMEQQTHFMRQEAISGNPNAVRISVVDSAEVEDMEVQFSTSQATKASSVNGSLAGKEESQKDAGDEKQPVLRSARIRERSDRNKKVMKKAPEKRPEKPRAKPSVSAKAKINLRERAKTMCLIPLRKTVFDHKDYNPDTRMCLVCNIKFATMKSLNYHMRSHHGETRRVHPCPKCSTKFMHMWGLTRHLKRTHNLSKGQVNQMRNRLKRLVYALPADQNHHKGNETSGNENDEDGKTSKNNLKGTPPKSPAKGKESPHQAKSPKVSSSVSETLVESAEKFTAVKNLSKALKGCHETQPSVLMGSSAEKPKKEFSVTICSRTVTKSPQFASGLSITPCRVCGKAFAKKENLQAHSLVCKSTSPTGVSEATKERMSALRASNRRRQLSPSKIDKTSVDEESDSSEEGDHAKLSGGKVSTGEPILKDKRLSGTTAPRDNNRVSDVKHGNKLSVQITTMTSSPAGSSFKIAVPCSSTGDFSEAAVTTRRSALRRQRSSSEASDGKDAGEQKGILPKPLEVQSVATPLEPRRSMRSCGQTSEKTIESSFSDGDGTLKDQSASHLSSFSRKQKSPAKASEQCEKTSKPREPSVSPKRTSLRRVASPAIADVVEMTDSSVSPMRKSRTLRSPSETRDSECSEDVASDVSEESRPTTSASQGQFSIQKTDQGTHSAPRRSASSSGPGLRKDKEGKDGTSQTEMNTDDETGSSANIVEITDNQLLQVKLQTEAELSRHISEVSRELGAVANPGDGDSSMQYVEEIWVGKTPGHPTETLKCNRVFVINPNNFHKGRHFCQDSKIIDALIDENSLKCFHCGEVFANVSNIRRHVIRHLGWKRYRCKMCAYCSYNRSEMRRHLVKAHNMAVTHITETALGLCITDLSKEVSRAKANRRSQQVTKKRTLSSGEPSHDKSHTPKRTVANSEVSQTNTVKSNPRRYNISTRQSPRVFDVRPLKTTDSMQTLLTRKGVYPKKIVTASNSLSASSAKPDDAGWSTLDASVGAEPRSAISDSVKHSKTKSVDFRKTRSSDNPWVDGFYTRLSGGTLGALRKEQGFHSFRKLGRSSTGTFTTNLTNSFRGSGIATRNRVPNVKPVAKSQTALRKETASSGKLSVKSSDLSLE